MTTVNIGMAQIRVDNGQPEFNLERARQAIEIAASQGAQLVVLPETLDLGWIDPTAFTAAEPIPGSRTDFFCLPA